MIEQEIESTQALWDAIVAVPGVGVAIVDQDGRTLYANDQINEMLRGEGADSPVGRTLHEMFPKAYADERVGIIRKVLATGRPVLLRHIRRGVQLESALRPLERERDGSGTVLTITRKGVSRSPSPEYEIVESQYVDLGELDVLSRRELEVLALLGQGLSIADIARVLFRSPKTIEKHRASISRKLGIMSRAELARLVHEAGLELRDANLKRYRLTG